MTAWHICMLAMIPLMLSGSKTRTWLAMFVAGTAPWMLPEMSLPAYIFIDAVAGAVTMRNPYGIAQRLIGACFALLVMFHVGFLLSRGTGVGTYYDANIITGWVQLTLLATWGLADAGKAVRHWARGRGSLSASDARV